MAPVKKPPHKRQRHFLKEWREYNELSQEAAAEICGMSRENYGRIENGKVPYQQDMLEKLAERYGVTMSHLISVDPEKEDRPREIYEMLQGVPRDDMERAFAVISALIKR